VTQRQQDHHHHDDADAAEVVQVVELAAMMQWLEKISLQLDALYTLIQEAIQGQDTEDVVIMATIQDLQDSVAANTTVGESVLTLVSGLSQQLADAIASGDPTALQNLKDQLDQETQRFADAVAANTPAATEPPAV